MIDHIAFKVESISDAVGWYCNTVGANVEYQDDTWAMLNVGGVKLALVLPGTHPNHIAIRCENLDELPCDNDAIKHMSEIRVGYKFGDGMENAKYKSYKS